MMNDNVAIKTAFILLVRKHRFLKQKRPSGGGITTNMQLQSTEHSLKRK